MRISILTFLGAAVLLASQLLAAQQAHEYPLVMSADAPFYPPIARMAKITGKIDADFTIKNGEVVAAEAKAGHPLLVKATTENIKSWHFAPEANGTFTTTFIYELHGNETATMQNPKVEMQLPTLVKITATPTKPSCNDCEPGAEVIGKPIKNN
jgi:Gram-negative bacterial TonB protein C-terminal